MTEKELEKLYKNTPELEPPSELKEKVLLRMSEEMEKKKEGKKEITPEKKSAFSFATLTKRLIPLAACAVFVFIIIGGFLGNGSNEFQTVYIDVNPSVALKVDDSGEVVGVEYINNDAKVALNGITLMGLAAEDALEKMINVYDSKGCFEKEAEIHISAVSEKSGDCDELLAKLKNRAEKVRGNRKYSVNVNKLTAEDKNEAEELGISPAKYRLIKQIIAETPSYTVEELKGMSMAELNKILKSNKKP